MTKKTKTLNPLRTSFDIDMELDEVPYKLTFKLVNKQIKNETVRVQPVEADPAEDDTFDIPTFLRKKR